MALDNTVRAILLDLDGTLADSLSVMQLAYRQFLSQFRREPSELEFASLNGPPLTEVVRRLKSSHALDQDEATLLSNYFEIIDATYSEVRPSFGAGDLLQAAKKNNCTVGIVTSNTKQRTQTWLKTVKLSHMIDFIVSGDETTHGKPHPEPYIIASKLTASRIEEIVAIEDSFQGAMSAVDAGLRTLVIGHEATSLWPQKIERIYSLREAAELLWKQRDVS